MESLKVSVRPNMLARTGIAWIRQPAMTRRCCPPPVLLACFLALRKAAAKLSCRSSSFLSRQRLDAFSTGDFEIIPALQGTARSLAWHRRRRPYLHDCRFHRRAWLGDVQPPQNELLQQLAECGTKDLAV